MQRENYFKAKVKTWENHYTEEKIQSNKGAKSETGKGGKKRKMEQNQNPNQVQKITNFLRVPNSLTRKRAENVQNMS